MATNAEILGLAGEQPKSVYVQLPDGSYKEMTAGEYAQFEKLDRFQQVSILNKLAAAEEMKEFQELNDAGSDPKGREEWMRAMRMIGRA